MSEEKKQVSRRDFIKVAGLAAAAVQAGGMLAGGVAAGADPESYTGWESYNAGTQKFNRKPFEVEYPQHQTRSRSAPSQPYDRLCFWSCGGVGGSFEQQH